MSFKCPLCSRTSYNPNDEKERYCGACHIFFTEPIILPTNTCFDDALDYVEHRLKGNPALARQGVLFIVHAICLIPEGPQEGERFAHAWVEETDVSAPAIAWQGGIMNGEKIFYSCDAAELRAQLRVQEFTRYTLEEACRENRRTATYGPWLEQYEALCKNSRKRTTT